MGTVVPGRNFSLEEMDRQSLFPSRDSACRPSEEMVGDLSDGNGAHGEDQGTAGDLARSRGGPGYGAPYRRMAGPEIAEAAAGGDPQSQLLTICLGLGLETKPNFPSASPTGWRPVPREGRHARGICRRWFLRWAHGLDARTTPTQGWSATTTKPSSAGPEK